MPLKISRRKTAKAFLVSVFIHLSVLVAALFSLQQSPEPVTDGIDLEFITVNRHAPSRKRHLPRRSFFTKASAPSPYFQTVALDRDATHLVQTTVAASALSYGITATPVYGMVQLGDALNNQPLDAVQTQPISPILRNTFNKRESLQESEYHSANPHPILNRFLEESAMVHKTPAGAISQALLALIHKRIQQHKRYPRWAQEAGYEGTVEVQFLLLPNGAIGTVDVIQPSGYKILDHAAVTAVKKSAPFPIDFLDLNLTHLPVRLTINFRLFDS